MTRSQWAPEHMECPRYSRSSSDVIALSCCFGLTLWDSLGTSPIFQTVRRTLPPHPNLGGKWGCVLQSECSLPGLLRGRVIYVIKYFTTFFASVFFSYFPPLKPRCVSWSENTVTLVSFRLQSQWLPRALSHLYSQKQWTMLGRAYGRRQFRYTAGGHSAVLVLWFVANVMTTWPIDLISTAAQRLLIPS